jgi:hypothetical protein
MTMPATATAPAASRTSRAAGEAASCSSNRTAPMTTPATGSTVSMIGRLADSVPAWKAPVDSARPGRHQQAAGPVPRPQRPPRPPRGQRQREQQVRGDDRRDQGQRPEGQRGRLQAIGRHRQGRKRQSARAAHDHLSDRRGMPAP